MEEFGGTVEVTAYRGRGDLAVRATLGIVRVALNVVGVKRERVVSVTLQRDHVNTHLIPHCQNKRQTLSFYSIILYVSQH